ncbi:MAG: hypothetical protein K6G87_17505 [Butyrivibrio sp.]|uniref:hypothetical protein n=1 Tax=Butyrivibrio sp. TaxID=28121 RepID=UPI0025E40484|nr:hypothetical protein [Butyrivibrio sp.]MCR5773024.1 hypothetical protein [Butyrivibrio sp.]
MRDNLVRKEFQDYDHKKKGSEVHLVRNTGKRPSNHKAAHHRRKPANKAASKYITIKNIFIRLCFVIVFVLIVSHLDTLFSIKTYHGIMQNRAMYAQPKDTVDVVFMGSSHIHCDVNTAVLWDNYGIAGYDYSAAEQPIWITYYYLKEFCKNQNPEVVVIDLYSIARFGDDFNEFWMPDNVYGMNFSLNKARLMLNSCTKEQINKYFPSFAGYHNRYNELEEQDYELLDISEEELSEFKGYTPYFGISKGHTPSLNVTEKSPIPEKSKRYLQKIIDYTNNNGIELMLIVNPYPSTIEDEKVYNSIEEMAMNNGVEYVNMNKFNDAMGLNTEEHYYDDSHLNYEGSCVFSNYLGECLKLSYILEDHRGNAEYKSWDSFSERVYNSNVDVLNSL